VSQHLFLVFTRAAALCCSDGLLHRVNEPSERERYSRQVLFPGIGEEGQGKLLAAQRGHCRMRPLEVFRRSPGRAGVGRSPSSIATMSNPGNLQRQWLFEEADAEAALPRRSRARRSSARQLRSPW